MSNGIHARNRDWGRVCTHTAFGHHEFGRLRDIWALSVCICCYLQMSAAKRKPNLNASYLCVQENDANELRESTKCFGELRGRPCVHVRVHLSLTMYCIVRRSTYYIKHLNGWHDSPSGDMNDEKFVMKDAPARERVGDKLYTENVCIVREFYHFIIFFFSWLSRESCDRT